MPGLTPCTVGAKSPSDRANRDDIITDRIALGVILVDVSFAPARQFAQVTLAERFGAEPL